ncbi:hypothetical protein K4K60_006422 [Colletotrichum sp. SAR11_57]|nr:hypothetical protein K4K60_006422 [Colletotrichum sp. SAR11_57]
MAFSSSTFYSKTSLLTSNTMAITELVFLPLKDDEDLKARFYEELPGLMQHNFDVPGGPDTAAVARILESNPEDADDQRGYVGVISWDRLDTIKAFLATPNFATFKSSLLKFVEAPPVLQFFEETVGATPRETLQNSTHLFVIKATGAEAEVENSKIKWNKLVAAFQGIEGNETLSHCGDGREVHEGQFAGFSGWKSITALNDALRDVQVQEHLKDLRNSGAQVSTFILELKQII